MNGRRWLLLLVVLVAAVGTSAIAATVPDPWGLSTEGRELAATSEELGQASALERIGFASGMRLVTERAGAAFYIGSARETGGDCYAVRPVAAPAGQGGVSACRFRDVRGSFPSAEAPVGDVSLRHSEGERADGQPVREYVRRLTGFATDGVSRVGVVFDDGTFHWADVEDNVYAADDVPQKPVTALVAEDAAGNQVYEQPVR